MTMRRQIRQRVEREIELPGGRELQLTYRLGCGHPVPAILLLPTSPAPVPAAILLHGYSSRKEVMAGPVGRALLERGVASLAVDLPLHGTRADPLQSQSAGNPLAAVQLLQQALDDVRLGLHYLAARSDVAGGRLGIVGYSMGAFLSVVLAAREQLIRAVVLAAGGDLPQGTPFAAVARMVADPLSSVQGLNGRPLLMVHGRRDATVRPDQAQRLFDAARQPKEIRWYDAGHYLPQEASTAAADWLGDRLGEGS
ncbi:hypothetical protein BH23GEM9_BH23GEM9_25930 [soil metagenome]